MKFMISFLIAMLTVASVGAITARGRLIGLLSVAIPKITEVLVIQTPRQAA